MQRAAPPPGLPLAIVLLRRWRVERNAGRPPLPRLFAALDGKAPVNLVVACDSLFALAEAILGRRLEAGYSKEPELSTDERGILLLIRHGRKAGPIATSWRVPHGLPGVLSLAAFAVQQALLELGEACADGSELTAIVQNCPFENTGRSELAA